MNARIRTARAGLLIGLTAALLLTVTVVWAAEDPVAATTSSATGPATSSAPASSQANEVPEETLSEIAQPLHGLASATSRDEARKIFDENLPELVKRAKAALQKYPTADNLYMVRAMMLQAFQLRDQLADKPIYEDAELLDMARQLKDDKNAPDPERVQADAMLVGSQIKKDKLKGEKLAAVLTEYKSRWTSENGGLMASMFSVVLARQARDRDVHAEMLKQMEKKYGKEPAAQRFIEAQAPSAWIGHPFNAKLTTLEGKTLTLPQDLKGKPVVIDFWATWCPPCAAEAPKLKAIYDKYKDKVAFVGISLDDEKDKAAVETFVKDHGLAWTQTFSGLGRKDPTAQEYEVESIPTEMVLDKNGNIYETDARGELSDVLDEVLAGKTAPKPTITSSPASIPTDDVTTK